MADISHIDLNVVALPPEDPFVAFSMAMRDIGLFCDFPESDGEIHRVRTQDDKAGKRSGWYWFNVDVGVAGDWRTGVQITWHSRSYRQMDPIARALRDKEAAEARARAEIERAQRGEEAAAEATRLIALAQHQVGHPYLKRKGLPFSRALVLDGYILVPRYDIDGNLRSYQSISPDGEKRYQPGGQAKETFHWIEGKGEAIYVCEGYATGLTVNELTGCSVAVAFDAGNLTPVAKALREVHARAPIIIAGDNDQGKAVNAGKEAAERAAAAVNGEVKLPEFPAGVPGTDWNDLAEAVGKERAAIGLVYQPPRYRIQLLDDVRPRVEQQALIRGVIGEGSMTVTYGKSNVGKSFHVMHRDLCLAAGINWYDREVKQGFVIYVAAEGGHSIVNRLYALRQTLLEGREGVPFLILPQPLDLLNPEADAKPITEEIKRWEDKLQMGCAKVTADTLARVIGSGNENAAEDMGSLIRNADYIRHQGGCAFEFLHHSGKDEARGARGHSSLRAATDTEIEVTADNGLHVATVTKQRDFEGGEEFAFRLNSYPLGNDQWGHPVTTAVLEPVMDHKPGEGRAKRGQLSSTQRKTLKLIREVMNESAAMPPRDITFPRNKKPKPDQKCLSELILRDYAKKAGKAGDSDNPDTIRRTLSRHIQKLQDLGLIEYFDGWIWWPDNPDN